MNRRAFLAGSMAMAASASMAEAPKQKPIVIRRSISGLSFEYSHVVVFGKVDNCKFDHCRLSVVGDKPRITNSKFIDGKVEFLEKYPA